MIQNLMVLSILSLPLFAAGSSAAEDNSNNPKATQQYVGEATKILEVFDTWAKASTDCNSKTLMDIYHPKISFWPSVAETPFYGIDDTVRVFEEMCERNPFLRVTPIDRFVDLEGDTAVVFGSLEFRRMLNSQLTEIPVRYSFTLVKEKAKEKAEWKILHMQSVTLPFTPKPSASTPDAK